jgi:hypothetical protein
MANNELEQWCEIDGHDIIRSYMSFGLGLGPRIEDWTYTCRNCGHTETEVFVPKDSGIQHYIQIFPGTLWTDIK